MSRGQGRTFTVVSLHAHPDDEALLTAGTLAKISAAGHRVILVVATAGEAGLARAEAAATAPLGEVRLREVKASAAAIGISRVVALGYADSGYSLQQSSSPPGDDASVINSTHADDTHPPNARTGAFVDVEIDTAAAGLAEILRDEAADVLTIYDRNGGYGHPDHVQVHRVGLRAARLAGTKVVLEATIDRTSLNRVVRLVRAMRFVLPLPYMPDLRHAYTSRAMLTHRIDIREQVTRKWLAMAAHESQTGSDVGARTLALFLRLPRPLFRRVFRYEWFREVGVVPTRPLLDDVFATLVDTSAPPTSAGEVNETRRRPGG